MRIYNFTAITCMVKKFKSRLNLETRIYQSHTCIFRSPKKNDEIRERAYGARDAKFTYGNLRARDR